MLLALLLQLESQVLRQHPPLRLEGLQLWWQRAVVPLIAECSIQTVHVDYSRYCQEASHAVLENQTLLLAGDLPGQAPEYTMIGVRLVVVLGPAVAPAAFARGLWKQARVVCSDRKAPQVVKVREQWPKPCRHEGGVMTQAWPLQRDSRHLSWGMKPRAGLESCCCLLELPVPAGGRVLDGPHVESSTNQADEAQLPSAARPALKWLADSPAASDDLKAPP